MLGRGAAEAEELTGGVVLMFLVFTGWEAPVQW